MPLTDREREALHRIAGDVATVLRLLATMRHCALEHQLPLTIPASQPFAELLEQMARLKHPSAAPHS